MMLKGHCRLILAILFLFYFLIENYAFFIDAHTQLSFSIRAHIPNFHGPK